MSPLQPSLSNRILSRLSETDFAILAPLLEPVRCPLALVLVEQDTEMPFTYFLETGLASLVPNSPEGQSAEGGIVGREGYVTPATILGSRTIPYKINIQMVGDGYRLPCEALIAASNASATLRDSLLKFAQALMVQMTYSVLANAVHPIDERLARWLLMVHDRSNSDDLALTHNFMALMLAVRRPSVTTSLHVLEGNGFIRTDRGYVAIRDRAALEAFAGDCYGTPEREYRRLLGPM
jgi:CRP-like cAMP-binding protein